MRGQRGAVFNHLKVYGAITSWEAIELYGCTRLAAVICDLRKMGYGIETVDQKSKNRFGETVTFGRYVLVEGEEKR